MAAMYALDNDEPETVEAPNKRPDAQPEYKSLEEKVGLLCKTFPGTAPEYWKTGVSKIEATRMASAVSCSESSGAWATSEQRARLIANYLSAVKCIAFKGGRSDG
jgi:antibiotic biosynthesis monooxygenase (ABM) superfamily enzyme